MARPSNAVLEERRKAEADRIAAAVAAALADAKAQMLSEVQAAVLGELDKIKEVAGTVDATKPQSVDGDKAFASMLALKIAELSAQSAGSGKVFVSPEKLEERQKACERMIALLVNARAAAEKGEQGALPVYRVIGTVFLNDTRVYQQWFDEVDKRMKDTRILWDEVPNLSLEPVNDIAKQVYAEFLEWSDEKPPQNPDDIAPWVVSNKRLFRGMGPDERTRLANPESRGDPRMPGFGAEKAPRYERILGNIHPPAAVR